MNKKLLKKGMISSLDNSLWDNEATMALAVVIENNGQSIVVIPAHSRAEIACDPDLLLSRTDSKLPFDIVLMLNNRFSLPINAFAANKLKFDSELFENLIKNDLNILSENSGMGPRLTKISGETKERKQFLEDFARFRLNSWQEIFIEFTHKFKNRQSDKDRNFVVPQPRIIKPEPLGTKSSALKYHDFQELALQIAKKLGIKVKRQKIADVSEKADLFELISCKLADFIKT